MEIKHIFYELPSGLLSLAPPLSKEPVFYAQFDRPRCHALRLTNNQRPQVAIIRKEDSLNEEISTRVGVHVNPWRYASWIFCFPVVAKNQER